VAAPVDRAESITVTYSLALEWATGTDGTPICYDDGADFDELDSTITMRLTPTEVTAWESIWQGARKVTFLDWSSLPLGPTVTVSDGVAEATLVDFYLDGPADSSMTLFDAVAKLHYGPLDAPGAGSITEVFDHGVPYHSVRPLTKALHTDGATYILVPATAESDRSCQWYASGLSRDDIASAIDWLRNLRGGAYSWTAAGQAFPFGPGESQTALVKIPSWTVTEESNFTWGLELEVIRVG
jgi:hypothetical protein